MTGIIAPYREVTGPVVTCDLDSASSFLTKPKTRSNFVGVISIADPQGAAVFGAAEKHAAGLNGRSMVVKLNFDDAEQGEEETADLATPEDVQRILRWGRHFHDHFNNPSTPTQVLIHCHAGMGRSALLCAAVLVAEDHSVAAAWELVKTKRPIANLHPWQHAALEDFAQRWAQQKDN